jgi:hypothetical protein
MSYYSSYIYIFLYSEILDFYCNRENGNHDDFMSIFMHVMEGVCC